MAEQEVSKHKGFPVEHLHSEGGLWSGYTDDITLMRFRSKVEAYLLEGKSSDLQLRLRRAFAFWKIQWSSEKAVEGSLMGERLGVWLDGLSGRLGSTTERLLADASLGLWLVGQPMV